MDPVLYRVAAQAVLDMEGYFLEFAGPVTIHSVFPGHGALEGLLLVQFADALYGYMNENRSGEKKALERLQLLYNLFVDYFSTEENGVERLALGLRLDEEGDLRWELTGRKRLTHIHLGRYRKPRDVATFIPTLGLIRGRGTK